MGNCIHHRSIATVDDSARDAPPEDLKLLVLSQLSHDLNSCLSSIMLGVDILLDEQTPVHERLTVERNMRSSYEFILMLSRKTNFFFSDEKLQPKMGIIDVSDMLFRVTGIIQQMTLIPMHCQIDPNVPRFTMSDPAWLWDILLNLLGNSKKFTLKGSIATHVQIRGDTLLFSVKDTGIGVPDVRRDQLFKVFKTSDSFHGTGVGLYGCKKKIDALGGDIGYMSNQPEGSIFWFSVPHVECSHFSKEMVPSCFDDVNASICSKLRFLIVDDDVLLLRLIKTFLERFDVKVTTAASIAEATALLDSTVDTDAEFDCLVTDKIFSGPGQHMINNTGFELIRYVKQHDINIYSCILTGSLTIRDISDVDVDVFLKPISKKVSRNIVTKTIDYHSLANVLIVDDDVLIRTMLLKFCEYYRLRGTSASNGEEALRALEMKRFTLIFVDVHMPIVSGIDFLKQFNKDAHPFTYVCVVSGNSSNWTEEEKVEIAKANEVQMKPLRSNDMLAVFERALDHRAVHMKRPVAISEASTLEA